MTPDIPDDRPEDWQDDDSWWHQQDLEMQRAEAEMNLAHNLLLDEIEKVMNKLDKGLH